MKFSIITLILSLGALASAAAVGENAGRPTPTGSCCVADGNEKEDSCTTAAGAAGRCVPGGNSCGSALSCIALADLACDASIIERGKSLCRTKADGGFIDGDRIISSLSQATVATGAKL